MIDYSTKKLEFLDHMQGRLHVAQLKCKKILEVTTTYKHGRLWPNLQQAKIVTNVGYMVESAPSNSCMVRSVIAHFAFWRIIRAKAAKHNMVDSGTKQSKFFRTF